ncbi:DNA-binding transcriptional regulator, LysR family [Amycolatopsis sacchari]|uniref:DNA-binding transcriptional regulator, LysR family n=1 Tax=Amycolatopsis sacchari TaxID=115433 RepID=A0A1I3MRH3_9PSEU|nr:LysR family transcriptional regulator [Amycolatopsis sacchari]SFI99410.1 DNA-binding transcriptional regulator, LysR family [Amycolatopsis sacchari]
MRAVELRHLEYFLAVADTGGFTQAAKALHVVQSGVSATIKALERELGAELFTRTPQEVTLTAAGRTFLPRARETLDSARAAKDAVHGMRGAVQGTVTVGTLTSIDLVDLPELLAALRARYPGVTVRLRAAMAGSAGLAQHLREGRLDVAFLALPPADLDTRLLASAPLALYVPGSHPLARTGRATLAQLAEFPFVDTPPGFANRTIVDQAFAAAGVTREVTVEIANVATAARFIQAGLGIGFLGHSLVPEHSGLATVEVTDADLRWELSVATASTRRPSAATRAFLDLLAERHPSP